MQRQIIGQLAQLIKLTNHEKGGHDYRQLVKSYIDDAAGTSDYLNDLQGIVDLLEGLDTGESSQTEKATTYESDIVPFQRGATVPGWVRPLGWVDFGKEREERERREIEKNEKERKESERKKRKRREKEERKEMERREDDEPLDKVKWGEQYKDEVRQGTKKIKTFFTKEDGRKYQETIVRRIFGIYKITVKGIEPRCSFGHLANVIGYLLIFLRERKTRSGKRYLSLKDLQDAIIRLREKLLKMYPSEDKITNDEWVPVW